MRAHDEHSCIWKYEGAAVSVRSMKSDALRNAQQAYIRAVLDKLGITASELARRAGVAPTTFTRFLNSRKHATHLSATTLQKVADASGIQPPSPSPVSLPKLADPLNLKVWGRIAAGVWREVSTTEEEADLGTVPVAPLPKYAGRKQYALLVEGPSVNRKIKPGDYAICVEYGDMPNGFQDGQYIHIERHRSGLVEATVKLVKVTAGGVELWPDSDHPMHQQPITIDHEDEGTSVMVKGVVIGSFAHWE